jgi:hypothetical protein
MHPIRLIAAITMLSLASTANAACPSTIAGSYSAYQIRYLADGTQQTSVGTHVFTAPTNGIGTETIYLWESVVDSATNTGSGTRKKPTRKYKYDKTTCRGYTWAEDGQSEVAGTLTIRYFAVAASGNNLFFTQGPRNVAMDSSGNPSTTDANPSSWIAIGAGVTVLTKQ